MYTDILELHGAVARLRATAYEMVVFRLNWRDHVLPNTSAMSKVEAITYMRLQWEEAQAMTDPKPQTVFQYALLNGEVVSSNKPIISIVKSVTKTVKRRRDVITVDNCGGESIVTKRRVKPIAPESSNRRIVKSGPVDPVNRIVKCWPERGFQEFTY